MNWSNVRLIWFREVRDQLRDRRTLFMIAVLPVLLYPLIGMTILHVSQFVQEHPSRVLVVGVESLPQDPPILATGNFDERLFSSPDRKQLVEVTSRTFRAVGGSDDEVRELSQKAVADGEYDVAVFFPLEFSERLSEFRESVGDDANNSGGPSATPAAVPHPEVFFTAVKDRSRIAHDRVVAVLHRWRQQIVSQTLASHQVAARATTPFQVRATDVAEPAGRRAAVWSKILPFILLVWALTGAFYPAIDLCAGEKERGTLETLLTGPAERAEIVWGKLLTVTLFSMATSLLNLGSMCFTMSFVVGQLQNTTGGASPFELGPPPWTSLLWLLIALVPTSALFSALSLALATLARSTKEGQYYLMPLMLVCLPLLMLPVLPAAELSLGTSLIPVTGVMLLLRTMMEGELQTAALYAAPVIFMTAVCCWFAIRWAVDQFNNETVLFRESERIDLFRWLVYRVRHRAVVPTVGAAIFCGIIILTLRFFLGLVLPPPVDWHGFALVTLVALVCLVAMPAIILSLFFTRSPAQTFLLTRPRFGAALVALLLACAIHPLAVGLLDIVHRAYPLNSEALAGMGEVLAQAPSYLHVLLLLAVAPAICEELAFRGFILSGLRSRGGTWGPILITSLLFGFAHGLLQQSLISTVLGVLLGYLAVQTGSLLPCVVFHAAHNSLGLLASRLWETWDQQPATWQWLIQKTPHGFTYHWMLVLVSGLLTLILFRWLRNFPRYASADPPLRDMLEHRPASAAAR